MLKFVFKVFLAVSLGESKYLQGCASSAVLYYFVKKANFSKFRVIPCNI